MGGDDQETRHLPVLLVGGVVAVGVDDTVCGGAGPVLPHLLGLPHPRKALQQTELAQVPQHSVRLPTPRPDLVVQRPRLRHLPLPVVLILQIHPGSRTRKGTIYYEISGTKA